MRKDLSSSNVLVVGLATNCEDKIEQEINKINAAFSEAKSVKWLVIESDSDDGTLATLNELGANNEFDVIALGKLRAKHPKRTERIAKCRNRYLEELRKNTRYNNVDYVVVADLDGVNSELTPSAVKSCWQLAEDWDACFANQSEAYYDIWALRHDVWSPNDCWQNYDFLINNGKSKFEALNAAIYSRMIKIKDDVSPIEVDSAFGGLGIYKTSAILSSEYIGLNSNEEEFCEHVSLHATLRTKGFRLYIVPSLINCGWNEHNQDLKWIRKIKSRIRHSLITLVTLFISRIRYSLITLVTLFISKEKIRKMLSSKQ